MLLLLRGHIRVSFDSSELYNFVKILYDLYKVEIYIQTWSVVSNSISWRTVADNPTRVTEEMIRAYFKEIPIKHILILDDTKINIIGNKDGLIIKSGISTIGLKNMWYGISALADFAAEHEAPDTMVIHTRLDIFCNSNNPRVEDLLPFIKKNKDEKPSHVLFISPDSCGGIDNFTMATVAVHKRMSNHFNTRMDEIVSLPQYSWVNQPERLVFMENVRMFGAPINSAPRSAPRRWFF